ncbi:MAG TPA: hypothetical protein VFW22_08655 [Pseudolabrys sp.]|nr:hypothetical protein [Pseudolabrys sp.]
MPDFEAETIYVVGGLYGNLAALEAVEQLAAQEMAPVSIVFNGDFHWFDADVDWFVDIERGVSRHRALRGNVETEAARSNDIGAGCGCAYPESVAADVVTRSNEVLTLLRDTVPHRVRPRLRDLPMHLVVEVAGLRVGIVHGDATALAGWKFGQDELDDASRRPWLDDIRATSHIDVFASTHTCLAALRDFVLPAGQMTVINNGAAGMPNFGGSRYGLISRVAATPSPHRPLYGLRRDDVHIDAIPLKYDHAAFLDRFLARWPAGSPAYESYYQRIADGPNYSIAQAAGR